MTPSIFAVVLIMLIMIILIATSLKVAEENERFAEFTLGRFVGFRGPGLCFRLLTSKMHRLSVGDLGVVSSPQFITFGGIDIPLTSAGSFNVGATVRIDGFDDDEPRLVLAPAKSTLQCPNCGHEF